MLIPKLLFQGKVDNGKEGLDFESYSFDFNAFDSSITITLGCAAKSLFAGGVQSQRNARARKLAEMREKIINELKGEPFLLPESALAMQTESKKRLKIDSKTALLLAERMARSGNEDIALGAVWINILILGLNSDDRNIKKELFLKIINNQLCGYINYAIDNNVNLQNDMKHVFYIGDFFKMNSTMYKIHESLARIIRTALQDTIIELLDGGLPLPDMKDCSYGRGYGMQESHGIAFVLSEKQFRRLESVIKTKSKVIAMKQDDIASSTSAAYTGTPHATALNPPAPQEESLLVKTEKYLNENVFSQGPDEIPQYQVKADLLSRVKTKFLEIRDIDALVSLYDFICEPQNKNKLNIHRNFGDTILLNFDTKGWQDLIAEIRTHALNVLFEKYNLHKSLAAIEAGQQIYVTDPAMFAEHLSMYSKTKLFSQHRSNMNFFNLFHSTQAVGKIKKVVAACESQIKLQTSQLKPN